MISSILRFFYLIVTALLLMWPAFFNGYPFLFPDSGSYIWAAFTLEVPVDRAVGYAYFIRLLSSGGSLWPIVFAQSFLASIFIYKVIQVLGQKRIFLIHGLSIMGLALLTSSGWFVAQIMPDVMVPLLFLMYFAFLFNEVRWYEYFIFLPLIALLLITHSANFLISFSLLILMALYCYWKRSLFTKTKMLSRKFITLFIIVVLTPLFFMMNNYYHGHGFTMNPSSYVFLMARIHDAGILDKFLQRTCSEHHYVLCDYQGKLLYGDQFIWNPESVLNKVGWIQSKPEYEEILSQVFRDPYYDAIFIYDSGINTLKLLTKARLDPFTSLHDVKAVHDRIVRYYPQEVKIYSSSLQFQEQLQDMDQRTGFFLSIACLASLAVGFLWARKKLELREKLLALMMAGGIGSNAVFMATLSGVYGRYNSRVMWLMPLVGFIILGRYWWRVREN